MSIFVLKTGADYKEYFSPSLQAVKSQQPVKFLSQENLRATDFTGSALIVMGAENFSTAAAIKERVGSLALVGVRRYPDQHNFLEAIDESYDDLLKNRFALSVGMIGDKSFILTGERGIELARTPQELASKFSALFKSRYPQRHNKTVLDKIDAFPPELGADCEDMFHWMQEWEKLALFPSYQKEDGNAVYPEAEFGFVAKRTDKGTLVTARASNKTNPSAKDITLITSVGADGTVEMQSTGRKASLNGPLAHLIFQHRPEIQYIVHSHLLFPAGATVPAASAPGTLSDWRAIEAKIRAGENIINQPCHGSLILLENPEDLLPLLKSQSLYKTQSEYYDLAYARFQTSDVKLTSLERFIESLDLPDDIKALDMCCGTGASTLALQKLGLTNIDIADGSANMLAVAEQRLGKTGRVVSLENLDALEGNNYGLVTMRQAFNYVAREDLKSVFQKAWKILDNGGHFVFNSFQPLPDGVDRRQNISENKGVFVITNEINEAKGELLRHAQRSEIIDINNAVWSPIHDVNEFYQHSPEQVIMELTESGFKVEAQITGNSICYHGIKTPAPGVK